MWIYLTLTVLTLVALFGPPIAMVYWHRRDGGRYRTAAVGALAFVASQAARIPFLIALGALLRRWFPHPSPEFAFWLGFAILCATSGIFEEGARYLAMRYVARGVRAPRSAAMFGIGHGGIESMLFVGLNALFLLALVVLADLDLLPRLVKDPRVLQALQKLVAQMRAAPWIALLAAWERVFAIAFHVAASVIVARAVRDRALGWLWLAMALHAACNAVAVGTSVFVGPRAGSAVLALSVAGVAYVAHRAWRGAPTDAG